jgi:hypothetical protein
VEFFHVICYLISFIHVMADHHVYTNTEMADMHLMYGLAGCNSREAQRLYQQHFPNRGVPHYQTFISIHARLQETGSFFTEKK